MNVDFLVKDGLDRDRRKFSILVDGKVCGDFVSYEAYGRILSVVKYHVIVYSKAKSVTSV